MNREEARKHVVQGEFDFDIFAHILDRLDDIEKRLAALERPKKYGPIETHKPKTNSDRHCGDCAKARSNGGMCGGVAQDAIGCHSYTVKPERPKTYGPIEIPKPEIKFHLDDEEIARIKAIVADRKAGRNPLPDDMVCQTCHKVELLCDCGSPYCPECDAPHELVRPGKTQPTCECEERICPECLQHECDCVALEERLEKQQYRTMAEHIEHRPEGMTEDEARQDFIERAFANVVLLEFSIDADGVYTPWNLHAIDNPDFIGFETSYRLPLDADGELPDYPLLRCPDADGEPYVNQIWKDRWTVHSGDIRRSINHTEQAARAMWNKWMRERFGCSYGEGE